MIFEKFEEGMGMFLITFDNLNWSKDKLSFYFKMLKDMSDEEFINAIKSIITKKTSWFLNDNFIAIVRQYAKGDRNDNAILAWQVVLKAIKSIGQYATPDFEVVGINETIEMMGGWIKLCTGKEEDLVWRFRDFEKIFYVMSKKGRSAVQLLGIHELNNQAKGFETKAPILIKAPEQEKLLKG